MKRSSLGVRVVASTVALCTIVISILAFVILIRVQDGIRNSRLEAALSESQSSIYQTELQFSFLSTQLVNSYKVALDDVITNFTPNNQSGIGREVILIQQNSPQGTLLETERTTNLISKNSIPDELRNRVRTSSKLEHAYGVIISRENISPLTTPTSNPRALIVGGKVAIPTVGIYEIYFLFNIENEYRTLSLLRGTLLVGGIVLILLIALIVAVVVRQVVRPVRSAAQIAEKLAAGQLEERMSTEGAEEIASLGSSFNDMANVLQEQILRLENLSRVQQRFVADVSHELRTPLTTMRMAADVLYRARENFEPTISRSTELLLAQIDRFEHMLSELLEVSRFDAGVVRLEPEILDFKVVVRRSIDALVPIAHDYQIDIHVTEPAEAISVVIDPRRIDRILRNLLINAIEHAENKDIEVLIKASELTVAVSVRDFGVGLRKNELNRVFDRFWRADPARARTKGGTGLGLSIAQEDAQLHGGVIEVWGEIGKGSQFTFTFPRERGQILSERPIPILHT
jgi:two-component system sensor histidine kinase MtrB